MQNMYQKIEQAIAYIEAHADAQPDLDAVASEIGLSPFHVQRQFKQLAGISPKRFLQHTTLEKAKQCLTQEANLLDTAFSVGLSGTGRLHDLFLNGTATTPGGYKSGGDGITLTYGVHETPFGVCLLAITPQGICEMDYFPDVASVHTKTLRKKWPHAEIVRDDVATQPFIDRMFAQGQGSVHTLPLHLRGTNFQLKVWQALLNIPEGALSNYSALAEAVGSPKAVRAVGSAVGDNPIAYLIPCHRVLRKDGGIGGYATGTPRKRAMLAYESLLFSETSMQKAG